MVSLFKLNTKRIISHPVRRRLATFFAVLYKATKERVGVIHSENILGVPTTFQALLVAKKQTNTGLAIIELLL